MKKLKNIGKYTVCCSLILFCVPDPVFCKLYIPVTELIPDKVIDLLDRDSKLKLIHIFCYIFCKCIDCG